MKFLNRVMLTLGLKRFTPALLLTSILLTLSVFNYGFDQVAYSTIQAQDPFIGRFGTCNAQGKCHISTRNLSFLNSFPRITFGVGIVVGHAIGERWGRRIVVVIMLLIAILGTAVSYTASGYPQILVGRMIVYMYIGMEGWLVPMFQAEIVPAQNRGSIVVTYTFNHIFGAFVMSCITYKTSQWDTDMAWKLPFALCNICPGIVLLCIWAVPESPRWLLRKGRHEEALKMMKYIYGANPYYHAEEELELLRDSLASERERDKVSWLGLFRGVNLTRTMVALATQFLNQATGQVFVSQYGTIFIKSLNSIDPFKFNVINNAISCIGPFATILLVDRIGRRRMYLVFGTLSCLSIMVIGILGCVKTTVRVKEGIVALDIIFFLFYIMSFGPIGALTSAECPSLDYRDKTANIGWNVQNLMNFIVAFTIPYLLNPDGANLGSKLGFIYGAVALLGVIWAYFYLPEFTGRSLEEIDEMFAEKVPARKTRAWVSTNPTSIGHRITQMEALTGTHQHGDGSSAAEGVRDPDKATTFHVE